MSSAAQADETGEERVLGCADQRVGRSERGRTSRSAPLGMTVRGRATLEKDGGGDVETLA